MYLYTTAVVVKTSNIAPPQLPFLAFPLVTNIIIISMPVITGYLITAVVVKTSKIIPPQLPFLTFPLGVTNIIIISMSIITGYLIRGNYYSLQHLHTMPQSHYHLITMRLNKAEK